MSEFNQEIKQDKGKLKLSLVPLEIVKCIARVREMGLLKYPDRDSWKRIETERIREAAFRHFLLYMEEPYGTDAESGLPHLWHLASNIAFLCELEKNKSDI